MFRSPFSKIRNHLVFLALSPLLLVNIAQAQWSLDNDASQLSFVSVKADNVAEVHTFDLMTGSIDAAGNVAISIELASVNTMIDIRNERMQTMLFETAMFPNATISARTDVGAISAMRPGASAVASMEFSLTLHGASNSYTADVMLTRLADGVVAATLKPVIVTADSFALVAGVERLREVAGLTRISNAVPVSFTVVFRQGR